MSQHGVSYRLPQRLAGRTCQQRRADPPGAVRADGADRLVLAGEVVAERPQRNASLGRDVLDGDVLQALDQVRWEELRNLTDAEALAATEDLLDLLRFLPPRQGKSGLVEQQRMFARARA